MYMYIVSLFCLWDIVHVHLHNVVPPILPTLELFLHHSSYSELNDQ